jgi:hypothetical protein
VVLLVFEGLGEELSSGGELIGRLRKCASTEEHPARDEPDREQRSEAAPHSLVG